MNLDTGGTTGGARYTPAFVIEYDSDGLDTEHILTRGRKGPTAITDEGPRFELEAVELLGTVDPVYAGQFVAGYLPDSETWYPYDNNQGNDEAAMFEYDGPGLLAAQDLGDWTETEDGQELQEMADDLLDNELVKSELWG